MSMRELNRHYELSVSEYHTRYVSTSGTNIGYDRLNPLCSANRLFLTTSNCWAHISLSEHLDNVVDSADVDSACLDAYALRIYSLPEKILVPPCPVGESILPVSHITYDISDYYFVRYRVQYQVLCQIMIQNWSIDIVVCDIRYYIYASQELLVCIASWSWMMFCSQPVCVKSVEYLVDIKLLPVSQSNDQCVNAAAEKLSDCAGAVVYECIPQQ